MRRAPTLLACVLLVAGCGGDEHPPGGPSTSDATELELRATLDDLTRTCTVVDGDRLSDRLPAGHRGAGTELPPVADTASVTAFEVIEVAGDTAAVSVTLALDDDGTPSELTQVVHLARDDGGSWRPTTPLACPTLDAD